MAYFFSLTDAALYLELPAPEPMQIARRVVSVETLEGTDTRDFGPDVGGLAFTIESELNGADLHTLASAVDSGNEMGLALSLKVYSVCVSRMESRLIGENLHGVKLGIAVSGEI